MALIFFPISISGDGKERRLRLAIRIAFLPTSGAGEKSAGMFRNRCMERGDFAPHARAKFLTP